MRSPADLILHNANIITLDESKPGAAAVAIRGQRIAAVGTDSDILFHKGPKTRIIDCQGKAVVPGVQRRALPPHRSGSRLAERGLRPSVRPEYPRHPRGYPPASQSNPRRPLDSGYGLQRVLLG